MPLNINTLLSVIDLMQFASGELDTKLQLAKITSKETIDSFDILRGRALSASIALVYFTSLVAYALYTRPASETTESYLFMLQFMILSIWTGCLVEWRDAIMILTLALSFLAFIYQRGRKSPAGNVKAK